MKKHYGTFRMELSISSKNIFHKKRMLINSIKKIFIKKNSIFLQIIRIPVFSSIFIYLRDGMSEERPTTSNCKVKLNENLLL